MMKAYKNKDGKWFSGDYRVKQSEILRRAISIGKVKPPTACNRCGQTNGVLHTHIEDYDNPLEYEPLCIVCHIAHHSSWFAKEQCDKYFAHVATHGPERTFHSSKGVFSYLADRWGIKKK